MDEVVFPSNGKKYQEALALPCSSPPPNYSVTLALLPLLMSSAHAGEMQSVYKAIWDLACLAEHFKNSFLIETCICSGMRPRGQNF